MATEVIVEDVNTEAGSAVVLRKRVTCRSGFRLLLRKPDMKRCLSRYKLTPGFEMEMEKLQATGELDTALKMPVRLLKAMHGDMFALGCAMIADCSVSPRFALNEDEVTEELVSATELDPQDIEDISGVIASWCGLPVGALAELARFPEPDDAGSVLAGVEGQSV